MDNYSQPAEGATNKTADPVRAEATDFAHELEAISSVLNALGPLSDDARRFVIRTASDRLGIRPIVNMSREEAGSLGPVNPSASTGGLEGTNPQRLPKSEKTR